MKQKNLPNTKLLQTIIVSIIMSLPIFGLSQSKTVNGQTNLPKSFAVFVARYNADGAEAVGGVAGTAFFVSPGKAYTAFHVLQASSFSPSSGFQKVKIWLVHENRPAIEVKAFHLKEFQNLDMTVIDFGNQKVVSSEEIYPLAQSENSHFNDSSVESNGFIANSTGPELARSGEELVITKVPALQRIHARGQLLRAAQIQLNAKDVKLTNAHCIQLSYQPVVGLSGGPLLNNGRVIAMNSFADPSGQTTWAVKLPNFKF